MKLIALLFVLILGLNQPVTANENIKNERATASASFDCDVRVFIGSSMRDQLYAAKFTQEFEKTPYAHTSFMPFPILRKNYEIKVMYDSPRLENRNEETFNFALVDFLNGPQPTYLAYNQFVATKGSLLPDNFRIDGWFSELGQYYNLVFECSITRKK